MVPARLVANLPDLMTKRNSASNQSARILRRSYLLMEHAWNASHIPNLVQEEEDVTTQNVSQGNKLDSMDSVKIVQIIREASTPQSHARSQYAKIDSKSPRKVSVKGAQVPWLPQQMEKVANIQSVMSVRGFWRMAPASNALIMRGPLGTCSSVRNQSAQLGRKWTRMVLVRNVELLN